MTQIKHGYCTWLVSGYTIFASEGHKAEKDRMNQSPTSLEVYATTPQEAIEKFVEQYNVDVRITSVKWVGR